MKGVEFTNRGGLVMCPQPLTQQHARRPFRIFNRQQRHLRRAIRREECEAGRDALDHVARINTFILRGMLAKTRAYARITTDPVEERMHRRVEQWITLELQRRGEPMPDGRVHLLSARVERVRALPQRGVHPSPHPWRA
jgi:hypothetical protein